MTGKIYLVGTLHWDLKGENRLYNALGELNPDIVTVEYSPSFGNVNPNQIANIAAHKIIGRLKSCEHYQFDKETIAEFARLTRAIFGVSGYETKSAKRFAEESGIPFHEVGNHDGWKNAMDNYDWEYTENEILMIGSRARLNEYIERKYAETRESFDLGINPENEEKSLEYGLTGKRDLNMSSRIRELAEQSPEGRVVHVGGAWHFYDSPNGNTVYSQLADLSPERVLINEFECVEVS